ncbi:MAG: nitrous oxide reductase family maturation protein NosD [Candidatus Hodarchaeota archaeon]
MRNKIMLIILTLFLLIIIFQGKNLETTLNLENKVSACQMDRKELSPAHQKGVSASIKAFNTTLGPIQIINNTDFSNQANANGWPGNGTSINPYIIQGYNITNPSFILISIRHTTVYFIIRNNVLKGVNRTYEGIHLFNVTHGSINNNTIHYCSRGIFLESTNNTDSIYNNTIHNNSYNGIELKDSHANIIKHNTIYHNGYWNSSVQFADRAFSRKQPPSGGSGIYLDPSHNTTISNNTVYNNRDHGICLSYANYTEISNNNVTGNGLDGVHLYCSNRTSITGNNISKNDEDGMFLENSHVNTIEDNNIFSNGGVTRRTFSFDVSRKQPPSGGSGIYLDPSHNTTISNNTVYNNQDNGICLFYANYTEILDNNITENGKKGIYLYYSNQTGITGNNISKNDEDGMFLENSHENTIEDNNIFSNGGVTRRTSSFDVSRKQPPSGGSGIYLDPSHRNLIVNNTISNNQDNGISLSLSINIDILDNNITENGKDGISLFRSNEIDIIGNNISWNDENGVYFLHSNNSNVLDNIISNNKNGLVLTNSYGNTIQDNLIFDNGSSSKGSSFAGYGIYLDSCTYISIINNGIFSNRAYGVSIDTNSHHVTVTCNNFSENNLEGSSQAFDEGYYNMFLYNFWGENSGSDANDDGVNDNPYSIDGRGNSDPCPLAAPAQTDCPPTVPSCVSTPGMTITFAMSALLIIAIFVKIKSKRQNPKND